MAAHRPSELAWFLTAFHQRENPSLTSREDSLALRLKSLWSIVSPYSCHKREGRSLIKNAAAASGRMWDASPGNGAASFEPRVTLNWAAIKSQADLPVSCSSLPPAVGGQCAWAGCFWKVLFLFPTWQLSLVLGYLPPVVLPGRNLAFSCSLCFQVQFFAVIWLNSANLGKVLVFFFFLL